MYERSSEIVRKREGEPQIFHWKFLRTTNLSICQLVFASLYKMANKAQIKKQVEFYFGDSNFPKDKFLRAQAALNEEGCKQRLLSYLNFKTSL